MWYEVHELNEPPDQHQCCIALENQRFRERGALQGRGEVRIPPKALDTTLCRMYLLLWPNVVLSCHQRRLTGQLPVGDRSTKSYLCWRNFFIAFPLPKHIWCVIFFLNGGDKFSGKCTCAIPAAARGHAGWA